MKHTLRILVPVAGYLLCGYVWLSGVHVACKTGGSPVASGGSGLLVMLALLVACVLSLIASIWSLSGILQAREWLIFIGVGVASDVAFSVMHVEWLALVPPSVYALNLARVRLDPADRIPAAVAFLLSTWLPVMLLAVLPHVMSGCLGSQL